MIRYTTRLNAYILVLYYTLIMVFCVMVKHPIHLGILMLGGIVMAVIVAGARSTLRMLGYSLIMSVLIVLINPLVSREGVTKLIEIGNFYITLESLVYGIVASMMLLSVFMWFVSFNVVMTSEKYIYVLGRFLPSLSLLISLTLRLIPRLNCEYEEQRTYGLSTGMFSENGLKNRIRLSVYALKGVIRHSIENSSIMADSMEARGYGITHRSSFLKFRVRAGEIAYLVLTLVLGGMVIAGYILGYSYASYYPVINIEISNTYTILSIVIMTLFVMIPIGGEVVEEVRWKRYLLRTSA